MTIGIWIRQRNAIAEDSNALAEESDRIAQSSVDVVVAADARMIEQHYVRWNREWADAGVLRLTNIGQHAAHDVVAQVHVLADRRHTGDRAIVESARIDPGEHVDVECVGIRSLHGAIELDYAAHVGGSGIQLVPFQPEVEERGFWRSPLGTPHDHMRTGPVWFDAGEVHRRGTRSVEGWPMTGQSARVEGWGG